MLMRKNWTKYLYSLPLTSCLKAHRLIILYVSLNTVLIPKAKIFKRNRTQDEYRVCNFPAYNLAAGTNNFVPDSVLLPCLDPEIQKSPSTGLEDRSLTNSDLFLNVFLVSRHEQTNFCSKWFNGLLIPANIHKHTKCIQMIATALHESCFSDKTTGVATLNVRLSELHDVT
jgi:hypothetical protein